MTAFISNNLPLFLKLQKIVTNINLENNQKKMKEK
jgi:hypothetical protein